MTQRNDVPIFFHDKDHLLLHTSTTIRGLEKEKAPKPAEGVTRQASRFEASQINMRYNSTFYTA